MSAINIMALRHSAFYAPLLMTIAGEFLQRQGLQPHYRVATPDDPVDQALASGSAHLSQSAVATSFATLESGKHCDIVHFAQINERDGFFIAAREPMPNFQWSDLIGQPVLVDHFFQPLAMLRYGLHRQGISLDQLQVIDAGDVAAIDQAFRNGQAAFVHQQGPAPQQIEADGVGHLVAAVGDAIGPVAFSSLCATRDWLSTDMAQAFMAAYREGRQAVIERPAGEIASQLQGFFPNIDSDVLAATLQRYQQLGCWSPGTGISPQSYETLLDVFQHSGAITRRHPYSACITELV